MSLDIYNTLTRKVEKFAPLSEGVVKIYSCGVTTYDEIHLGHARQAIVFDVIRNYFQLMGYKVEYVRNYTDIDDKIIRRGIERGIPWSQVSEYYIEQSQKDLEKLKVKPATHEPKVTEHIPDIIYFIQVLIDKGVAYTVDGNVFLDITKIKDYGKISNRKIDELISEKEAPQKRNIQDFSLWKAAKKDEPFWDAPWGKGRPGWHIECSVLAYKYLGSRLDIHGGGIDLLFPHHENEIAQSEAFNEVQFANYWMHNGLVQINGQKMSKSLGNFLTVKDALKKQTVDEVRYIVLVHNYASQIDFSEELFVDARKRLYYFYKTLNKLQEFNYVSSPDETNCPEIIRQLTSSFQVCMDGNFNTAKVVSLLSQVFSTLNDVLENGKMSKGDKENIFSIFKNQFSDITTVLRIFDDDPEKYLNQLQNLIFKENGTSYEEVLNLISARQKARGEQNYQESDRIRDELLSMKVSVKDNSENKIDWDLVFD
jgi:cysteinyl-tRNA synthetase